jgi:hypothetical protein
MVLEFSLQPAQPQLPVSRYVHTRLPAGKPNAQHQFTERIIGGSDYLIQLIAILVVQDCAYHRDLCQLLVALCHFTNNLHTKRMALQINSQSRRRAV